MGQLRALEMSDKDKVVRLEDELQFLQQLQAEKEYLVQRINSINEILGRYAQLEKRQRYERIEDRVIEEAIITSNSIYEVVKKTHMTMAKKSYDRIKKVKQERKLYFVKELQQLTDELKKLQQEK